jgi:hypothetical protein
VGFLCSSYVRTLEERVIWLEERLSECVCYKDKPQPGQNLTVLPDLGPDNTTFTSRIPYDSAQAQVQTDLRRRGSVASPASAQQLPSPSESQIGPDEPLAHNVGLLSLSNARESKYLGPSSGVTFGKLIFASMPSSQGLPVTLAGSTRARKHHHPSPLSTVSSKPPLMADLTYFAACYFETYQPLYPFLDESAILAKLDILEEANISFEAKLTEESPLSATDLIQLTLVLALGAKNLESRLLADFSAGTYYTMALAHMEEVDALGGIPGVQILLLLTLCSFVFEDGLNAWYMSSTIIASCLDLGLQRKHSDTEPTVSSVSPSPVGVSMATLAKGIFWSAYSIDRTLTVVLGRPLTLRDEAIDAPFPGHDKLVIWSDEMDVASLSPTRSGFQHPAPGSQTNKRVQLSSDPYRAAMYSFWFDQITAEIKLMLHRVAQSPRRFPWPADLMTWQADVQGSCCKLLKSLQRELRWKSSCPTDRSFKELELKYHHCIMLLHRPSPAIQHPSESSLAECFGSAAQTIQIYAQLHRFSNMPRTWLAAHAVFVSGITMLYCLWTSREVKDSTTLRTFSSHAENCIKLLQWLGETWSVAEDAMGKLERLTNLTTTLWKSNATTNGPLNTKANTNVEPDGLLAPATFPRNGEGGEQVDAGVDAVGSNCFDNAEFQSATEEWGGSEDISGLFLGELGDMSSWFDLGWLADNTFWVDEQENEKDNV